MLPLECVGMCEILTGPFVHLIFNITFGELQLLEGGFINFKKRIGYKRVPDVEALPLS